MENSRVYAAIESICTWQVRVRPNPVVRDGLISVEYQGVSLASEDLQGVDNQRLCTDTIGFNDSEIMAVN